MSISPIITFKAGACDFDTSSSPPKVKPKPAPGYIYLYEEDELVHFCWRPRSAPMSQPELELVMVPTDGSFAPYKDSISESPPESPTNGRIFVLKFQSSTQRHLFWLQSRSQHPQGDPAYFSPRDLKLGNIVDRLLQGDEVDVKDEVAKVVNDRDGGNDGDENMEDAAPNSPSHGQEQATSGDSLAENLGAGGSGSGDGRAANEASEAVRNFLRSMRGNQALVPEGEQAQSQMFTTLNDLLPTSETLPMVECADASLIDRLLSHLPPVLLLREEKEDADATFLADPDPRTLQSALAALNMQQKKDILTKVLRSPQFSQSLVSLTSALRDGGLPSVSNALEIKINNGGFISNGRIPLGGGDAVEAFINGVKASNGREKAVEEGDMETQ